MLQVSFDGWGLSDPADVTAVVRNCADHMLPLFDSDPTGPILVMYDESGPMACRIEDADAHIIKLSSRDRLWAQLAYQFTHEFCHVLTKHWLVPLNHRFSWFMESICEVSSLYFLRRMSETWRIQPPYPNWLFYSASLGSYVDDRLAEVSMVSNHELNAWIISKLPQLMANPYERELNSVVAANLLPLFESNPRLWAATSKINIAPKLDGSLDDYFDYWQQALLPTSSAIITPIISLICGN